MVKWSLALCTVHVTHTININDRCANRSWFERVRSCIKIAWRWACCSTIDLLYLNTLCNLLQCSLYGNKYLETMLLSPFEGFPEVIPARSTRPGQSEFLDWHSGCSMPGYAFAGIIDKGVRIQLPGHPIEVWVTPTPYPLLLKPLERPGYVCTSSVLDTG